MANCAVAASLDVVGTRSAILILREAIFGTRRFEDFVRRVGIGEPAAAARLKELTAAGLLERVPYQEPGQRTRYEYQLTDKGMDFQPVVHALLEWGSKWETGETGPALRATHRDCGATVGVRIRCEAGHDVDPEDVAIEPGPGLITIP
ncbi:helix-turn-helix domain-containing protein [Kribbella jejuensis]|uniref:HxlR family transcriptional regulator n=2 Tax=Kribbella jejuensis TaxID=236068 RepID=A0A542DSB0_9ACTN|nr:HxlR family transcriptional regulator [Kribbella jejuensis]